MKIIFLKLEFRGETSNIHIFNACNELLFCCTEPVVIQLIFERAFLQMINFRGSSQMPETWGVFLTYNRLEC